MSVRMTGEPWNNLSVVPPRSYTCGYCSHLVASERGLSTNNPLIGLNVCPECWGATFFDARGRQWPGALFGNAVAAAPDDIRLLYQEARTVCSDGGFTACILLCRKILAHVAVANGGDVDGRFIEHVNWLISERLVPKGAESWLDYVRRKGNEANHEIVIMSKQDAQGVLRFVEALLRSVYELPTLVPKPPGGQQ